MTPTDSPRPPVLQFIVSLLVAVVASDRPILSYDAGDHQHSASGKPGRSVRGHYSLLTPDGNTVSVQYTADENGYVAVSEALPVPPAVPEHPAAAEVSGAPAAPVVAEVKAAAEQLETEEGAAPESVPLVFAINPYGYYNLPYATLAYGAPLAYAAAPRPYSAASQLYSAAPQLYSAASQAYSTAPLYSAAP